MRDFFRVFGVWELPVITLDTVLNRGAMGVQLWVCCRCANLDWEVGRGELLAFWRKEGGGRRMKGFVNGVEIGLETWFLDP